MLRLSSNQAQRLYFKQLSSGIHRRLFSSKNTAVGGLSKVLVANRGEIACRVIRTCRRLGIPTVAIYSVADGPNALHARMADEAYQIGDGPAPSQSYLLQQNVLQIAQQSQCDAIHPGYGFLSENSTFCHAVIDNNIKFVGPPASAMEAMGNKSQSKAIMQEAGVPTTPGYAGDEQDADYLRQEAATNVGYPLLIKAVMGGGGKGMRLVWKDDDFHDALQSCQREALAAFGDASVLLEKYLQQPRHVEVQVVCDEHGNAVHLYERDCSLQRRHQKMIEEAPSAGDSPDLRAQLGEMGKRAAQAVGYVNAGTVEFLLENDSFYFCEMNTRLQVEHPISEAITGIDLVEWQLRIAAGEELPITNQADVPCQGHAFEARVYAENPARNFLPATGTVWHHQPPTTINTGMSADGIRVDTGLQAGQDISVYYDPMISKLIVHGPDRQSALQKLIDAMKRYQIAGVPTNIDFLVKCASHPTFRKGEGAINTGFLDDFAQDVQVTEDEVPSPFAQAVGSFAALLLLENRIGVVPTNNKANISSSSSPWSSLSGSWRMGGDLGRARRTLELVVEHDNDNDDESPSSSNSIECISNRDGSFEIQTATDDNNKESKSFHVAGELSRDGTMNVVVDKTRRIRGTAVLREEDGTIQVRMWPEGNMDDDNNYFWSVNIRNPLVAVSSTASHGGSSEGFVKSPMPGKISRVNFAIGDTVKKGQVVMVMEAMKMEHAIKSPCDGVLSESRYNPGDVVDDGAVLLVVDSGDDTVSESDAV